MEYLCVKLTDALFITTKFEVCNLNCGGKLVFSLGFLGFCNSNVV